MCKALAQLSHEIVTGGGVSHRVSSKAPTVGGGSHLLSEVILVRARVRHAARPPNAGERRLGLGGLALLAALLGRLLLLHLLVAERRQGAGNLLDLVAGQLLGELLAELLEEKAVVRLLGAAGEDGNQGGAELLELRLGRGVEEGDGGEVDGAVGVAGVEEHGVPGRDGLALADADAAKEVLGVRQIGLLLKRAEAVPLLRLGLLVAGVVILGELAGPLGLSLGYALGLGLLVGGGLGVGLCLGLGGLLCLFALDFRVFGGIPGFENLDVKKTMVSSAMFVLLPGEKVGSEG